MVDDSRAELAKRTDPSSRHLESQRTTPAADAHLAHSETTAATGLTTSTAIPSNLAAAASTPAAAKPLDVATPESTPATPSGEASGTERSGSTAATVLDGGGAGVPEHHVNDCPGQRKPTMTTTTTTTAPTSRATGPEVVSSAPVSGSLNNWRRIAADTCRRADIADLMDSRVDDATEAVASHEYNNNGNNNNENTNKNENDTSNNNGNTNINGSSNSNNFSDNAKRLDSYSHSAAKASKPVPGTGPGAELRPSTATATTTPTATTTMTTSSGSGNHQINNYKIHHQLPRPEHGPKDLLARAPLAGELASPRCHSRESNASGGGAEARCPSNDSQYSGNGSATPNPGSPPVGLPLPATLAPSAAAAAYLNAAAVAAQQNHLLLTNPLAAAASLVQQASHAQSPGSTRLSAPSPGGAPDASALDFSTRRSRLDSEGPGSDDETAAEEERSEHEADLLSGAASAVDANIPLDLSLGGGRKRQASPDADAEGDAHEGLPPPRKLPRPHDFKGLPPGTWVPPMNPYLAAVAAASLSPKNSLPLDWSDKQKLAPNEATQALEKMTEMTRLGAATDAEAPVPRHQPAAAPGAGGSGGRHSAWQSHWLNKGADAAKDVFKCVWCKQSFPSLASLTTHMKETQHCGVNVPPTAGASSATTASGSNGQAAAQASLHPRHASGHGAAPSAGPGHGPSGKSDLSLLIKETMPLPRKLVRGQDVWLGKGAEQTRQILKCMWCGQSFRSLAEMTSHMQETQHYTNIISQEQIISWKSTDEKSSSGGSSSGPATSPALSTPPATAAATNAPPASAPSTVSAVLTCKVCDQAFASLKELSSHMVKNAHYKDPMVRPAGDASPNVGRGRGRTGREKRKKSLPVRKLLELERAQHDYTGSLEPALRPLRDFAASTKITCEKCGDKIETALFVDHIRQCLGGHIPNSPRGGARAAPPPDRQTPGGRSNGRKTADDNISPGVLSSPPAKEGEKQPASTGPSVLNAIEQLIEKSFDTRSRHSGAFGGGGGQASTPLGSSILKRLGIDESVDYTKPLMDPQTMHFLRSYSAFSGRDRSASESSSVSERGSSRLEALTPERGPEASRHPTPRLTPDRPGPTPAEPAVHIKSEPLDDPPSLPEAQAEAPHKISVKKEFHMAEDEAPHILQDVPGPSAALSPGASSLTPKSTSPPAERRIPPAGSSLSALSSMFNSLTSLGAGSVGASAGALGLTGETNNNNSAGKNSNSNPLAALQKLCEKTDPPAANTRSGHQPHAGAIGSGAGSVSGGAGNMVAFSWACNDAVTTPDAAIKCSFCDTPFSSKGAYRHHLSKAHFVKDDADSQSSAAAMKSPAPAPSPRPPASPRSSSKSPAAHRQAPSPSMPQPLPPTSSPYDESPQSKFLKYTELAKQLSSKNA